MSTLAYADQSSDGAFVRKAQSDFLGQYAIASLAQAHGSDPAVRMLAADVARNAASANRFLSTYAKRHDIALSGKPGFREDAQYGEMRSARGHALDKRFVQDLYTDVAFQKSDFRSTGAGDPALRRFAQSQAAILGNLGNRAKKLGG
jgi:hypothetical protein